MKGEFKANRMTSIIIDVMHDTYSATRGLMVDACERSSSEV